MLLFIVMDNTGVFFFVAFRPDFGSWPALMRICDHTGHTTVGKTPLGE
jgi:hypothetical protein